MFLYNLTTTGRGEEKPLIVAKASISHKNELNNFVCNNSSELVHSNYFTKTASLKVLNWKQVKHHLFRFKYFIPSTIIIT